MYFSNWTTVISAVVSVFGLIDYINKNDYFGSNNISRGLLILALSSEFFKDTIYWTLLAEPENTLSFWLEGLSHAIALPFLFYWFFFEDSFQGRLRDLLLVPTEAVLYLITVLLYSIYDYYPYFFLDFKNSTGLAIGSFFGVTILSSGFFIAFEYI
mmetsp:Transcript_28372/g.25093  ORF Transcript_28372/g.25093 Transcript_28372/m.25093 type:complete len:156 (+) Transcript_28372:85-552(+)